MHFGMPADERTSPAAKAFGLDSSGRGGHQARVGCQGQVVVRSEVDQFLPVEDDLRRLGAFTAAQAAAETGAVQGGKLAG